MYYDGIFNCENCENCVIDNLIFEKCNNDIIVKNNKIKEIYINKCKCIKNIECQSDNIIINNNNNRKY